jgi:glycosyltransferase involved in cell wall biosynthesis
MVEAAGAGKPVVASNIQPLPEVIGEDNALFFETGDSQGLADQLYKLVQDPAKRKAFGEKAKDFVRYRYSLGRSTREHAKLYLRLAQKKRQ